MEYIRVRGARTHNLKNVDVELPRNRLIVITGVSGSGKSSLAFDTLYAEGQRRYVESLSAYARQFLQLMEKPEVDHIDGLSPAIAIEQKSASHNPRSTVGTVTEVHDYLRLLFARVGDPHCPEHHQPLTAYSVAQMVDHVLRLPVDTRITILAPLVMERKGEHTELLEDLRAQGFVRVRIDGTVHELDALPKITRNVNHTIELVVDRVKVREDIKQRLAESFETALRHGEGRALALDMDSGKTHLFSTRFACPQCDYALVELEPRLFSFNNPMGACPRCDGLGHITRFDAGRVVAFPNLSLTSGAIAGRDRRNPFYLLMLQSLARHYGFDLEQPFDSLPEAIRTVVLYGSGQEKIRFTYATEKGGQQIREHPYEGIIPNLERRYREAESGAVRDELARYLASTPCPECGGARLRREALHVLIGSRNIHQIGQLPLATLRTELAALPLTGSKRTVGEKILREIEARIGFLNDVGLGYLTLNRTADTLSGGEGQRIRLASQIGSGLTGVMYVLDEPSIGLHQRDNDRLLLTLCGLRDLGNTVIVVEHDQDAIERADFVVDMGPGAGESGGHVVAQGTPADIAAHPESVTGQFLSGRRRIAPPLLPAPRDPSRQLVVRGATGNNLKGVTLNIPVGLFVCITGVSGSGKSTLINDTLYNAVARQLNGSTLEPAPHTGVEGLEHFDKVVNVDQSPIGRTPRSNPATYTGLFTPIRELFAGVPESRHRGYGPGRFSFNVKGGRCEACQGDGVLKVEMHFLPDVYVACDSCQGRRYNRETLEVRYRTKNIHEVLDLTVLQAHELFSSVPALARRLQTLEDVGLGYIRIGQSATTLSGGEAQRVKLALELSRRATGRTLYILDEPTTGLHFHDTDLLLKVLHRLRDEGNTIVVIEHNLDVVKTADWVIDLGPEGGDAGGQIIAEGSPADLAALADTHTGRYLAKTL